MTLASSRTTVVVAGLMLLISACKAATATPPVPRDTFHWLKSYDQATAMARKTDKMILAYFSGSDWDPYTEKIEKDVLSTEPFKNWANEHIIPLNIDFTKEKRMNAITKAQNDAMKTKYNVVKVPLFVFLDPSGAPVARVSYEDVRLHDEEVKGHPDQAIAFFDTTLKHRPPDEPLNTQPNFHEGFLFAKKRFAVIVMAITQGNVPFWIDQRDQLFKDQQFVRFMNHDTIFMKMDWPADTDSTVSAKEFRAFAEGHKLAPSPFQIVLWDVPYDKIKAKYKSFSLQHVDQLLKYIELQLPHIDYSGGWITDYKQAQQIAAQTDRFIFLAFTDMEGEWSQKIDTELFKSELFLTYAHKNLVLCQADYPKTTTQPVALVTQNKMLAEQFNIRGFPYIVVINPKGENIVHTTYMMGHPDFFMKQLTPIIAKDADRLAALKEKD
jgi:thioredoxin-related protein